MTSAWWLFAWPCLIQAWQQAGRRLGPCFVRVEHSPWHQGLNPPPPLLTCRPQPCRVDPHGSQDCHSMSMVMVMMLMVPRTAHGHTAGLPGRTSLSVSTSTFVHNDAAHYLSRRLSTDSMGS
ncbi:hypothetical protein V8C86DRAFT_485578 [Haematococcus lacustris]